ncbi:MAG TPA: hypothetical protein VKF36_14245 [Syntrophorhabdales bacterium]|nr:hypothetical protein [Syntrophorhabdales bacterium]
MARKKRASDVNILAKQIVDEATRKGLPAEPKAIRAKNPAAVALGRLGGLKGGKVRAEKLSPEKRKKIAQKAAQKRWSKKAQP